MVCPYAFPVTLAPVAGARGTRDLDDATCRRIALTPTGAFAAAFAVAPLDRVSHHGAAPAAGPV